MKKLALVFLVLIGGAGGAYYYFNQQEPVEKPVVTMTTISQGTIQEIVQATGTLSSLRTVFVGSQVSGVVKEIHVDYNSVVKKGQLMAEIDPSLLQVQVDIQEANYQRQLGEITNQEAQLEDAKRQLERTRALAAKNLVNQVQLEASELAVKSRTTSVESAKKQLLTTQANLDAARLNVEYTKIYAPTDGVVINRQVDRGVTVQASVRAPTFFMLATDLRAMKVSAGVDEADIGKIRTGMPVEFTVESQPGVTFYGDVEAVRLNATNANNVVTYPVWINAPNPQLQLKPSMTATLRIIVGSATNVVRIPNQALRFRPTSDIYTALGLTPPATGQGGRATAAPTTGTRDPAETTGAAGGGGGVAPDNLTAAPVELDAESIDDLFPSAPPRIQTGSVWTWDEAKKELKQIRVTTGITDGQFSQVVAGDLKVGQQVVANIILPLTPAQRQQQQSIFGQQPGQRRGGGAGFGPAEANAPTRPPPTPAAGGGGGRGGGGRGG